MKKLTKLFSAIAIVSALALVGCADPNGPATDNNAKPETNKPEDKLPEITIPSMNDFTQPSGGDSNPKDKLKGQTFQSEDTKYVFSNDGTVLEYELIDNHGPNPTKDAILRGKLSYKIDEEMLITDYIGFPKEDGSFMNKEDFYKEALASAKADPDHSPWGMYLAMANNDEVLAEKLFKYNFSFEYPVRQLSYVMTGNTLSVTEICPEITSVPQFYSLRYRFFTTDLPTKWNLPRNYLNLDYSNNKIYFDVFEENPDDPENPIITTEEGTWSKGEGTGNSQVITMKFGNDTYTATVEPYTEQFSKLENVQL